MVAALPVLAVLTTHDSRIVSLTLAIPPSKCRTEGAL